MKNTFLTFSMLLLSFCLSAQIEAVEWENFNSLPTSVSSFSDHGGTMWATANGNLFFSEDEGMSWTRHASFLFDDIEQVVAGAFGVTVSRHRRVSQTPPHNSEGRVTLYHSTDGFSFEEVDSIMTGTHHFGGWYFNRIYKKSDTELVKTRYQTDLGNVYASSSVSLDGGQTWSLLNTSNRKESVYNDTLSFSYATVSQDSIVFEIYEAGSTDAEFSTFPLPADFVPYNSVYRFGKIISISYAGQIVVSEDEGENWTFSQVDLLEGETLTNVEFTENTIAILTTKGLREMSYSDVGNVSFSHLSNYDKPEYANHHTYFTMGNTVFYSDYSGAYRKELGDENFEIINNGLSGDAEEIKTIGDLVWATRSRDYYSGDVYYTSDNAGETWTLRTDSVFQNEDVELLTGYGEFVIVRSDSDLIRLNTITGFSEVVASDISTFSIIGVSAEEGCFVVTNSNFRFFKADGTVVVGSTPAFSNTFSPTRYIWVNDEILAFKEGIRYSSSDFGETWTESEYAGTISGEIYETENGLISCDRYTYRSIDAGMTWVFAAGYPQYTSLGTSSRIAEFVGFHEGLAVFNAASTMYFTANEGGDSEPMSVPFHNYYGGIFTNYGYLSVQPEGAVDAAFKDGYLIVCTKEQGIFRTPYAGIVSQLPTEVQLSNIITGRLYKDVDSDCIFNEGDLPLVGKVISIGPGHGITNGVGRYAASLPPAAATYDYVTAAVPNYETICPYTEEGTVETEYLSIENVDVAFRPIPGLTDAEIKVGCGTLRPGFTANLWVRIENKGNEPLTDLIAILNYDADYLTVISAPDGISTDVGEWSFPVNLVLNEFIIYQLEVQISETTPLGTEITHTASIENSGDHNLLDNTAEFTQTVTGSYDPNDKVAFHEEEMLPYTVNEIMYRIRFQNTGTDTAFTVEVRDTLSSDLDILSFEMLEASHDYELKVEDPRILVWTFNNILLVDSLTNEPLSHGYIFFKINTVDDLVDGDNVLNDAAIYFDFNEPVITNEELVLIEKGNIYRVDSTAICTGDLYEGQIITQDTMIIETFTGLIYDTIQTTTVDALEISEENLTLYGTPGTEIEGVTVWSDTTFTQILETWQGCDSIITYQFLLNTVEIYSELNLCVGDEYNGMIVEGNFTDIDTVYGTFIDTIMITEVSAYPIYSTETTFAISSGSYIAGVQILTDTLLQFDYTTIDGCDSLVLFNVSIITANENIETTLIKAVLSPNPTENSTYLSLIDVTNKEASVAIYDARAQKVKQVVKAKKIIENDYRMDLNTDSLPSGLYYIYVEIEGQMRSLKLIKI